MASKIPKLKVKFIGATSVMDIGATKIKPQVDEETAKSLPNVRTTNEDPDNLGRILGKRPSKIPKSVMKTTGNSTTSTSLEFNNKSKVKTKHKLTFYNSKSSPQVTKEQTCSQLTLYKKPPQFNDLPTAIIEYIFSFLSMSDRIRNERVCKLWRNINMFIPWQCANSENLLAFIKGCKDDNVLRSALLRCGSTLRALHLDVENANFSPESPFIICDYCPLLEKIWFGNVCPTLEAIKTLAQRCQHLKSICFGKQVSEESVGVLLRYCQLEELHLSSQNLLGACFAYISADMKVLELNSCRNLVTRGFEFLHKCKNLQSLHVVDTSKLLDMESIVKLLRVTKKTLTELNLSHRYSSKTCQIDRQACIDGLSVCKHLQVLTLSYNPFVDNEVIKAVSLNCSLLWSLNVSVTNIDDRCCYYLKKLSRLTTLELWQTHVTDAGIIELSSAGVLESVCLPQEVGDKGCTSLLRNCANLKVLDVSFCPNVTEVVLDEAKRLKLIGTGKSFQLKNDRRVFKETK